MKKIFFFLLRIALAAGIISYLVYNHLDAFLAGLRQLNCYYLIPAAAIYAGHLLVGVWRWQKLAEIVAIRLTFFEALSLSMKALFFSLVIPGGAVGGDLAKATFLTARTQQGSRTLGVMTILMDRIVGMAAMFILTLILIAFSCPILMKVAPGGTEFDDATKILGIVLLTGVCLAGLGATVVLFFHRQLAAIRPIGFLMGKADKLTHGMVTHMIEAIDCYKAAWKKLTVLTVVSIFFVHLAAVAVVFCIAFGLGLREFDMLGLTTAVMVGNIAGLLPLTIAGVGLRDATIFMILAAAGIVNQAMTITLVYTSLIILFDLFGGIFFIVDADRKKTEDTASCPAK